MKQKKLNLHLYEETIVMFIIGCLVLVVSIVFFNKLYYNSVVITPIKKWTGLVHTLLGGSYHFLNIVNKVIESVCSATFLSDIVIF